VVPSSESGFMEVTHWLRTKRSARRGTRAPEHVLRPQPSRTGCYVFRSEAALICLGGYEAGVPRTTQVLTVAGIGRYTVYTKETQWPR
jgi:hypothetical protein